MHRAMEAKPVSAKSVEPALSLNHTTSSPKIQAGMVVGEEPESALETCQYRVYKGKNKVGNASVPVYTCNAYSMFVMSRHCEQCARSDKIKKPPER